VGTFKVNARTSETGKQTGRMIMRADGALRVMLNSPVFKGMTFGDAKNQEPTSKQILLASNEEGRTVPLLLRVCHPLTKTSFMIDTDTCTGWE
jgi:Ran-binding protein 3